MKKIVAIIVCVCVLLGVFTACTSTTSSAATERRIISVEVANVDGASINVLVDSETGVAYLSRVNCGITVMVDENGDPLIWEET